ncbi:MAG TPA: YihY/virulence factor BrkB family protein [Bacteroidales bacterium]|nr:YihY/virulence factor BrkB family protein [Bacteroidales bacterium]
MTRFSSKEWLGIVKSTFGKFFDDKGMKLSASLAYYTVFSLPALLILIIGLGGIFFGREAIEGEIFHAINEWIGAKAASQVQEMLKKTTLEYNSWWATILGVITLLIGASTVFAEIQDSINTIWELKPKPNKGLVKLVLNRLLSFSMIVVLGFLLMVSLILNAILSAFVEKLKSMFHAKIVEYFFVLDYAFIFVVITLLFAAIFKVLPDARIKFKDVIVGAMVTAGLFMLGRFLIEYYMQNIANLSAYGAAGSIIIILLWVYYTSIILYLGAEFTQVYITKKGDIVKPYNYAVRLEKQVIEKETEQ